MKKKITRMDLAGLRNHFEILTEAEKRMCIGCGTGTQEDPYTIDEFNNWQGDWTGGWIYGMGFIGPEVVVYGGGTSYSSGEIYGSEYPFNPYSDFYSGSAYGQGNPDSSTMGNDCVAHTIFNAISHFGNSGNVTFDGVNSWINNKYNGQGVPSGGYLDVIGQYFTYEKFTPEKLNGLTKYNSTSNKNEVFIAVLKPTSNNSGHSITILAVSGDSIIYNDDQTGNRKFCSKSDIYNVVKLTGLKK